MKLKKLLAAAVSGALMLTTLSFPAINAEDATYAKTSVSELKYDFTLTGVTTETSLTFEITTADSWNNVKQTVPITGDGDYSVTFSLSSASGIRNMGYFDTVDGSGIVASLTKLTVNSDYEISYAKTLEVGSSSKNGLDNIWGTLTSGQKIAEGTYGYFQFDATKNKEKFVLYTTEIPQDTGDEETNLPDESMYANMVATNLLTTSGDTLISNTSAHDGEDGYNGYIQSNQDKNIPTGNYLKVVYKVEGTVESDAELFAIQTYDKNWGGWAGLYITTGNSYYHESDGTYTAYLDLDEVKATLTTNVDLKGINISFMNKEPQVTLVSYSSLFSNKVIATITEDDLKEAGLSVSDWSGASKLTVYVHITDGDTTSVINAMVKYGPDDESGNPIGKASSKYLVGKDNTLGKSGNYIQNKIVGNAGTGNYAFPQMNLNKSLQDGSAWSNDYVNEITITVTAYTPNTDCEVLGIAFNNGKTYPLNFTTPVVESATLDVEKTSDRDKLKLALDYAATMDASRYTEDSYAAFQTALASAQAVYNDTTSSNDKCGDALAAYHKVKAQLEFVPDTTESNPLPFREVSGDETVYEMGMGINLGNTLDGHSGFTPAETAWQSVVTTKEYIKTLHDAGYNTIRIPVTWGTMIDDDNGYAINEAWLSRVQDIVDYAVSLDMYAIINIHHDGAEQSGWLRVAADDIDQVYEKYEYVWRNIAEYFKDYDEHLIFESLNEITSMEGDDKNSAEAIEYDTPIICNLNQIFVNTVRATGSNNATRWLAVAAHYANSGNAKTFTLPEDNYNTDNRLMFAAHIYKNSGNTTWTYSQVYEVVKSMKLMADKFDVPMYIGEYGTQTKTLSGSETGYNDEDRAYYEEIVTRAAQVLGIVPVPWDQGHGEDPYQTGLFTYWNRFTNEPIFVKMVEAQMRGLFATATEKEEKLDFSDITVGTEVTEISGISLSTNTVNLTINESATVAAEVQPTDTNDVVLWSSDNEYVATVYRGVIRARGIGTTTIRAHSQSGTVEKTITVTVKAAEGENDSTVTTEETTYHVRTGKGVNINASIENVNDGEYLTYKTSNADVATVNAVGKVVGISNGIAYVTAVSSTGATKTVKIIVSDTDGEQAIDLTLNVLYNDGTLNYYGNEHGEVITVTEDGQYTLTFDLAKDLSKAGKNAGVTAIKNLTAIFIKDADIVAGNASASPTTAAQIRWDKIVVDGKEMTITKGDFKSAMKNNLFDTNDPINSWEGSSISEVSVSNHVANLTGVTNPQTISITFTLKDMTFVTPAADKENEATSLSAITDKTVQIDEVGSTAELKVKLAPVTTDSFVSFQSSDESVVYIDNTVLAAGEYGKVSATALAMSEGTATITAQTENGLSVVFTVSVGKGGSDDESGSGGESSSNTDSESSSNTDSESSSDTDSESSSDTDSNSSSDTDSNSGSDTDSNSGSDTDSNSGSDTDSNSGSDTDSNSGSDTDSNSDSDQNIDGNTDDNSGNDNGDTSGSDADSEDASNPKTGAAAGMLVLVLAAGSVAVLASKKRKSNMEDLLNK